MERGSCKSFWVLKVFLLLQILKVIFSRALFSFSPDSPKELRLQAGQLVRYEFVSLCWKLVFFLDWTFCFVVSPFFHLHEKEDVPVRYVASGMNSWKILDSIASVKLSLSQIW